MRKLEEIYAELDELTDDEVMKDIPPRLIAEVRLKLSEMQHGSPYDEEHEYDFLEVDMMELVIEEDGMDYVLVCLLRKAIYYIMTLDNE